MPSEQNCSSMDRMLCCRAALEVSNYWWWVVGQCETNATI